LLDTIPDSVTHVSIWSDGPASQFKNRYILAALKPLQEKHNKEIIWNFFATSHGKGPVDGIGGAVKRVVWNTVRNRKAIVTNASSFREAAMTSNVLVAEIKGTEIERRNEVLGISQVFKDASPVPGIGGAHCMKLMNDEIELCTITSDARPADARPAVALPASDADVNTKICVGDWVLVQYEKTNYPGEVKRVEHEECQVSVMVPAGKNWKWPVRPDEIFYTHDNIVRRLEPPFIVNHRGHFAFVDF